MGSGSKKRREHEEDFIAFPSDSPSPQSSPSPSRRREQILSQIHLERDRKKQLRKWVSDDIQKLMGEYGSAEANRPKWNPSTQMFDLKENDIPAAERSIQVSQKDVGSDILAKRIEVERLAKAAGFYPDKENRGKDMEVRLDEIGGSKLDETENDHRRKRRKSKSGHKKHARKASDCSESSDDVEMTFGEAVINERGIKNSGVEMVDGYQGHKQKDKKKRREKRDQEEILESNQHEPATSAQEVIDLKTSSPEGNIKTKKKTRGRSEKMDAAEKAKRKELRRLRKKRKRKAKELAQEQHLSQLEDISQPEADDAVVETPKKKKQKMNHSSCEGTPDPSSAMSVYSSNPHKCRDRQSTAMDLVGNGSEDLQASPTFLIPASFLTKGFAKQQALLGTILKSCNFKSPSAQESTYNDVGMAPNYNHHESAILHRKLSIASSSNDSSIPVKKAGHVATRTPITPQKSTKPKPSRTKARPTPLADDSDSEADSPVTTTRANKSAGDNEREWEESFSLVVDSLKKTSVSKIKALFNEEGETSGEGESLNQVVNSIRQAASVEKIRSMFSPRPAAANGPGKRRMSVSSPIVPSKVNSDHSQHLQFRAIATCRPPTPSTRVSSEVNGEHLQHSRSPAGVTFQLLHIAPGHDEAFPAAFDGTKICSVAKGRVKVTYSTKNFNIGEGEVWAVRRGDVFIVQNPLSEEAVVHVVTIWDVPKFWGEGATAGNIRQLSSSQELGENYATG
jgi:mannose-6-phosphate isomerase-like protein (cupin superfamily)